MLKAVIIDDEFSCIESLSAKIEMFVPDLKVSKTFQVPQEGLREIGKLDVDVLFLDVEMPGLNGIAFAKKANLTQTEIIFTTAYQNYAVDAFRVCAFDFLLKPIDRHELVKSMDRLRQKIHESKSAQISRLHAKFNKITIHTAKGMLFVSLSEIFWMAADNNYTTLYLTTGSKLVTTRPIGEYEKMLAEFDFCRIHQSTVINLQHLQAYNKGEGGSVVLTNGVELEVSRRRKPDLLALIS